MPGSGYVKTFASIVALSAIMFCTVANAAEDSIRGPDVTIIEGEDRAVYEYRQNGQLRFIKVVPRIGKPYFLVPSDPTRGYGDLERSDMLLPSWPIVEF